MYPIYHLVEYIIFRKCIAYFKYNLVYYNYILIYNYIFLYNTYYLIIIAWLQRAEDVFKTCSRLSDLYGIALWSI